MKKRTLIISLFAVCLQAVMAQSLDVAKLDSYFQTLEENHKLMGSVSVARDGQTLYSKTVGFADVATGQKANMDSKYRIGSISKTFTAVLVFQAVDKGLLKLDQTLDTYFPEIQNAGRITIAQLLSHRSGIHNYIDESYPDWCTQPKTQQEILALIIKGGSEFEPDTRMQYSNSGYALLTFILEKIYKKSFSAILEQRILKPLKLENTYYGSKLDVARNECYSYTYQGKWQIEPDSDPSTLLGAGAVISTPQDLNRFYTALFSGKLVSAESLARMMTVRDGVGMGLWPVPFYGRTGYGHSGGIDGFRSMSVYHPDDKTVYSLTSNAVDILPNDISIVVLKAVYGMEYSLPDFTVHKVTTEELDQYLGVYSSPSFPLKITVTKNGDVLVAQATGQSANNLTSSAKDVFNFDRAGAVFEFNPAEDVMTLKQNGGVFPLKRE